MGGGIDVGFGGRGVGFLFCFRKQKFERGQLSSTREKELRLNELSLKAGAWPVTEGADGEMPALSGRLPMWPDSLQEPFPCNTLGMLSWYRACQHHRRDVSDRGPAVLSNDLRLPLARLFF